MIHVLYYNRHKRKTEEHAVAELGELLKRPREDGFLWVDLEQPDDPEVVILDSVFHFHPLVIEDCLHISEFPKIDVFPEYLFVEVLGGGLQAVDHGTKVFKPFEVDFFLGENYLVSFQPEPTSCVIALRERFATGDVRTLAHGADFLLYTLVDAVVDSYFNVLRGLNADTDAIEQLLERHVSGEEAIQRLLQLRQNILFARRILAPSQGVVRHLSHVTLPQVGKICHQYFGDVDDHLSILQSSIEIVRETVSDLWDVHQTRLTNRTNESIRWMTVLGTIFMLPMLLTSLYSMNVPLPGSEHWLSFWIMMLAIVLATVGTISFCRWRKWI